ncbi:UNVERIFIED_CONTAM: hypothetical protein PYX00_009585 [Menopon gallinae]|uniref:MULE transposase domain-containing protein n=1 Tax=Menopon gallinae TaxID=328185 RepID=A0AAW2HC68_9NEOP
MESISSQRGQKKLMLEGYLYCKEKDLNGKTIWKCDRWKKLSCHARIHVRENKVLKRVNTHNHAGDAARCEALKVSAEIKSKAVNTRCDSQQIIGEALANITEAVKGQMATINSMRRNIRRLRNRGKGGKVEAQTPEDKSTEDGASSDGEDFVLFDNHEHENRVVIFGTRAYLPLLSEVKDWYAEGSIQSVSHSFCQLYTIYVIKDGVSLPVVFCLVSDKCEATYIAVCRALKNLVPDLRPESILMDFEIGAINAFEKEFPDTRLKGCFSHFTRNILRTIQLNGLKKKYDSDNVFAKKMCMLAALAFVPGDDVERGFENLCSTLDADYSLENVLDHFEDTYVGRPGKIMRRRPKYKMEFWNMYSAVRQGALGTGMNYVLEGWHKALAEVVGLSHPTVKILESLTSGQSRNEKEDENGLKRLKIGSKYCDLDSKIEEIVKDYSRDNILEYLGRIASHFSL